MKQITCWYRQKESKGYYLYNHYEDGHSTNAKPTPQSEQQQVWLQQKWIKRHTIMINQIIQ